MFLQGFASEGDEDDFKQRRTTESQQGRVSMLACMDYMTPGLAGKRPGYLSPAADLKFAVFPNGLTAVSKVSVLGWLCRLGEVFRELSKEEADPGSGDAWFNASDSAPLLPDRLVSRVLGQCLAQTLQVHQSWTMASSLSSNT